MPFSRPSLSALIARTLAAVKSRLSTDQMRRSDSEVYARVNAGASHELHGHIEYVATQLMYDTCDAEYLARYTSIWKRPRKAAAKAVGFVTFTGADESTVFIDRVLVSVNGTEYATTAEVEIAAGVAVVPVIAVLPGAAGNLASGSTLSLSVPIPGVVSDAVVTAAGLTNGSDIEEIEAWRGRFLTRIRQPPHGGADFDYPAWALEVPGVTRAWVYPNAMGLGTVTVRFVRDNDANLIPDDAEVAAVQAYIDKVRPTTAKVYVVKPIADPVDYVFTLLNPNSSQVKAAIDAELRDLHQREAIPGGTLFLSHIREAISIAAGENNFVLSSPNADVVSPTGHMSTFGAITWP